MSLLVKNTIELGATARADRRFTQGRVVGLNSLLHTADIDVGAFLLDGTAQLLRGVAYSPQTPPAIGAIVALEYPTTSPHGVRISAAGVGGSNSQTTVVVNAANSVPPGGTTGQQLTKDTNADYDVSWQDDTPPTAAEVSYDHTASGLVAVNVQDALDELQGEVAEILQPISSGTYKISGGDLVYLGPGLQYQVTAGSGFINSVPVTWPNTAITFANGDVTNDRIDAVIVTAVGNLGTPSILAGTPEANPNLPDIDPLAELLLTFKIIAAGETAPPGVSTALLYDENVGPVTEWTVSTSAPARITLGNLVDPFHLTKCIYLNAATTNDNITFQAAAPFDLSVYSLLAVFLKQTVAWARGRSITVQWYLGTTKKGNQVTIAPGTNGFDAANVATYQGLSWQNAAFAISPGTLVDRLRLQVAGGSLSCRLDYLIEQADNSVTIIQGGGITQEEADARYERLINKSIDGTLAANSDTLYPTQQAVKTYVDAHAGGGGGGSWARLMTYIGA